MDFADAHRRLSEIADGLALFQEHRPQTGADWVAVAERFIADGADASQSSPLFAALVLAVKQRDAFKQELDFTCPDCGGQILSNHKCRMDDE